MSMTIFNLTLYVRKYVAMHTPAGYDTEYGNCLVDNESHAISSVRKNTTRYLLPIDWSTQIIQSLS